jgi:hypothetical protein
MLARAFGLAPSGPGEAADEAWAERNLLMNFNEESQEKKGRADENEIRTLNA